MKGWPESGVAEILIGGRPFPAPSSLRRTILPLGGRDRTAGGELVLEQAGFKQRLALTWASLPAEREDELRQALTREAFFTLTVPGAYGLEARETVCCLLSYESSLGPAPSGPPLTAETVRAELMER